jgi:hypothetical protein
VRTDSTGARLLALFLFASARAHADPPSNGAPLGDRPFGQRGSLTFGGGFGLGASQGFDSPYDTVVELGVNPAIDVFFAHRASFGMAIGLSYTAARVSTGSSLVSVSPRLGYALPIGARVFVWPRLSIDVASATDAGLEHRVLSTTLYAPMHAILLPHIALGVGPVVTAEILDRTGTGAHARTTTAGLRVEIVGWL